MFLVPRRPAFGDQQSPQAFWFYSSAGEGFPRLPMCLKITICKGRTMFALLLGVMSLASASSPVPPNAEKDARAALKARGALCDGYPLKGDGPVEAVALIGPEAVDADLTPLESLPKLRILYLGASSITDAGLEHLQGLTQLETLNLERTHLTGTGLKYLEGLRKIDCLDMNRTQLHDENLAYLKGMKELCILCISNTKVTDGGMKYLKPPRQA